MQRGGKKRMERRKEGQREAKRGLGENKVGGKDIGSTNVFSIKS